MFLTFYRTLVEDSHPPSAIFNNKKSPTINCGAFFVIKWRRRRDGLVYVHVINRFATLAAA
jgi:hypothetical protein